MIVSMSMYMTMLMILLTLRMTTSMLDVLFSGTGAAIYESHWLLSNLSIRKALTSRTRSSASATQLNRTKLPRSRVLRQQAESSVNSLPACKMLLMPYKRATTLALKRSPMHNAR